MNNHSKITNFIADYALIHFSHLNVDFQRATNAVSYDDDILSMNCDEMDLF